MKYYLLLLLTCFGLNAQVNNLNGRVNLVTTPIVVSDTATVKPIGRVTTGANAGRLVTMPLSAFGGGGSGTDNHKGFTKRINLEDGTSVSLTSIVNAINTGIGIRSTTLPFTVTFLDTPVALFVRADDTIYKYLFYGGNGTWGLGGTPVTTSMLSLISTQLLTISDVNNDPNTVTISLGTLPTGDYLTAANSTERDLSNPNSVYYFSYIQNGVTYLVQFNGTPGIYGGSSTSLQQSDLTPVTNSEITPAPVPAIPLAGTDVGFPVMGDVEFNDYTRIFSKSATDPNYERGLDFDDGNINLYVKNNITGYYSSIKAGDSTEGFTVLSDDPQSFGLTGEREFPNDYTDPNQFVQNAALLRAITGATSTGIPDDFYIGVNPMTQGTQQIETIPNVTYLTDTYRKFNLPTDLGVTIINLNEVVRNPNRPNDILLIGNFIDDTTNAASILLKDCQIINNVFTPGSITASTIQITQAHGSFWHTDGFVYLSSRKSISGGATLPQEYLKLNPYNFTDYKKITLPTTIDYAGVTTDVIAYKNYVYSIVHTNTTTDTPKLIRINTDFTPTSYEVAFQLTGLTSSSRVRRDTPFQIYNDELYLATFNNNSGSGRSNIDVGIVVYDLFKGGIKRQNASIEVTPTGTTQPYPHWMSIFNGKIILASASTQTPKWLARIDANSLAKEESVILTNRITDDNSIFSNGDMYLNEESYDTDPITPAARLLKMKYNDFSSFTVEITNYNNGYGSHGSLNPFIQPNSLKTKLSQFDYDLPAISTPNLEQVNTVGATTTKTMTVQDASTPAIKTVMAPASVKVSVPDGRAVEISGTEGIKVTNSGGFTTTLDNAGNTANNSLKYPRGTGTLVKSATVNGNAVTPDVNGNLDIPVASGVMPIVIDAEATTITGVTTETVIKTYTIPANRLGGGTYTFEGVFTNTGTSGAKDIKLYMSNTNAIASSRQVGLYTKSAASKYTHFTRDFPVNSAGSSTMFAIVSALTDVTSSNAAAVSFTALNFTQPIYFFITVTNAISGDDITASSVKLIYYKQVTP